jgi:hypothetical protein
MVPQRGRTNQDVFAQLAYGQPGSTNAAHPVVCPCDSRLRRHRCAFDNENVAVRDCSTRPRCGHVISAVANLNTLAYRSELPTVGNNRRGIGDDD